MYNNEELTNGMWPYFVRVIYDKQIVRMLRGKVTKSRNVI
jgi:hypothetical protein